MEEKNILVVGSSGSGKSSFIRLLLGRYAIGESRGFYTHHGYLRDSTPVRIIECPPIREESITDYYSMLEDAVSDLNAPVHHVLVLVKYSPLGFGGFRFNKEKNIPELELRSLQRLLGDALGQLISVVVSNWSRQFARIAERRQKGVTEDLVEKKLNEELAYQLSISNRLILFMDTVFWRTEQKSGVVPNTLPTTLETLEKIIDIFVGNSLNVVHVTNTNRQNWNSTYEIDIDRLSFSSDEDMENSIRLGEQWRNKKYQDLTINDYRPEKETSTLSFPVNKKVNIEIYSKPQASKADNSYDIRRAMPAEVISNASSSSSLHSVPIPVDQSYSTNEQQHTELSDYVESKVREMMKKEGVTLDLSDSKLHGKIVTKTTIIREVKDGNGKSQLFEDEHFDEKHFGSELDSVSSQSFHQYEDDRFSKQPVYSLGSPVLSSTFHRASHSNQEVKDHSIDMSEKNETHSSANRISKSISSSSQSSDTDETIEVIQEPVNDMERHQYGDMSLLDATVVILGTEPNISHIENYLKQKKVHHVICAPIEYGSGSKPYINIASKLHEKEKVVFVWAVETKTGEFSEDLVYMFADFIETFSPKAIESMIVVLWHPGSTEDIRNSVEDLTLKFEQSIEYRSSIGFAVLHFKPIPRFYDILEDKIMNMPPMIIESLYVQQFQNQREEYETNLRTNSNIETNYSETNADFEVIAMQENVQIRSDEFIADNVDSPVVLLLSPPGHGKSSVGNLLLGAGHFQVRGTGIGGNQTLQVNSGWLFEDDCRITCIESPGLYEDGVDEEAVSEMEKHLTHIGFITHLLIIWDALEWRWEDLDYVLQRVKNIFGTDITRHMVFVITFWDNDQKSKKERSKRRISKDSLSFTIEGKIRKFFNSDIDVPKFFVSAKRSNDQSQMELVDFLSSNDWQTLKTETMKSWLTEIKSHQDNEEDIKCTESEMDLKKDSDHDYEDVMRITSDESLKTKSKSKSMHHLDISGMQNSPNRIMSSKGLSESVFSLQGSRSLPRSRSKSSIARGRDRTRSPMSPFSTPRKSRGRSNTSNLTRKRSMSHGNIFSLGKNREKMQKGIIMHQKSVDNVYVEEVPPHQSVSDQRSNDNEGSHVQDADSIITDSNYQAPAMNASQTGDIQSRRGSRRSANRRRRRVVSGSSLSLNLNGLSKERGSFSRSGSNNESSNKTFTSEKKRRGSNISLRARSASNSRGRQSRHDLFSADGKHAESSQDLSSIGNHIGASGQRRGRSRTRNTGGRAGRQRSRPPPGECLIL